MTNHKDSEYGYPIVSSADEFEELRWDITYDNPTYFYLVNWSDDTIGGAEIEMSTTQPEGYDAASFFSKQFVAAASAMSAFVLFTV